ncbi:helix-turn-helix transcriptional regulator [Mycobacterium intermedium]|uniref:helix-turn-helix transcriptional regulator n=1 Tax=Mycobacterium intermedium TaxID=28445 RepID=UPI000AFE76A3|nr:helix-turn-helix transcriptional regulator [Mycobacterium intermedium]
MRGLPAIRHRQFHTIDPDTAQRFFASAYTPSWQIGGLAKGDAVTHRRCEAGLLTIDDVRIEGRMTCEAETEDAVVAIRPRGGSLAVGEKPVTDVVLVASNMPGLLEVRNARFQVASISVKLLRKVAAQNNTPLPQQIQFLSPQPRAGAAVHTLNDALDYVSNAYSAADTANRPLVVAAAAQLLTAALLDTFPSNLTNVPQEHNGKGPVPPAFKEAMAFIQRHAGHGIGVNDIAAAVNLTPRAVQYLFRQQLETTPTEYLRRVRLQRAHHDLVRGDQASTTVTEIAQRWGFAHTGRFAVLYRETYGQSPHTTLTE